VRCYDSEYYQWKIRENPIQSGEIWLAEINDQFVGMKSMTPKSLLFEKRLIDAAETGDTFTHRDFQRRGIFTSLFESALKEQTLDATVAFTYGVANEQSRPAYEKRLNYGLLPIKVNRWVKPIKFWKTNGTRRAIATRPILTAYSNCVEWFAKLTTEKNVRIIKVTEFPSDCDELFGKLSRNYDALFVRDKQSLRKKPRLL
jgi:GNAT superfamily N-acetyltransferase